ncbi:MAG: DMT family transporter, partial [Pseudomonadota bacterium]
MTTRSYRVALLELHLAVLLFGLAGVLGKAIAAGALIIVFGRSAVAALTLGLGLVLGLKNRRESSALPRTRRLGLGASGVLLAVHWLAFFHAINISSVAVGVVGYATAPLFVVMLEPLLSGTRLRPADSLIALAVLVGLYLVASPDDATQRLAAIGWAVFSGFTFALLTLLNRHLVQGVSFLYVAFCQQAGAAVCLLPIVLLAGDALPGTQDLLLIGVLGLACSALAQTLFVKSLEHLKAQL